MQDQSLQSVMSALDDLALAWLDYRTTAEREAKIEEAKVLIDRIVDGRPGESTDKELIKKIKETEAIPQPPRSVVAGRATVYDERTEKRPAPKELGTREAAQQIGVSPPALGHWIQEGIVPAQKAGRNYVVEGRVVNRLAALYRAAPPDYKNPTNYVAKVLRQERWGDGRSRSPYKSESAALRSKEQGGASSSG